MSENNGRRRVQLVNLCRHLDPIHIDCSGWKRAPGPRSRVPTLVSAARHLEPITVRMYRAVWLELVVSFEAGTPPTKVVEHVNRLAHAAAKAVPDLGLTYDLARSRGEGDDVVVALRPRQFAADTRDRLAAVAEVIRQAAAKVERERAVAVRVAA